jgi:uncharacterized protein YkwD
MLKSQLLGKIGKIALVAMLAIAGTNRSVFSEASKPNASEANDMIIAQNSELALARQVHQQVNEYRKSLNLAPLTLNAEISQQARQHSENMAENKVEFSHNGFDRRIKALKSISYRSAAENVAYNQGYGDPVKQAVQGWIESEGHRQNLTGNYNLTGIGVVKNQQEEYYFTQIFILD